MGVVLILTASISRLAQDPARVGGRDVPASTCGEPFGFDDAREIMEWEAMQRTLLLRSGAAVTLGAGGFIAFAVRKRPAEEQRKVANKGISN